MLRFRCLAVRILTEAPAISCILQSKGAGSRATFPSVCVEAEKRDYYVHAGRFWNEVTISTTVNAWQSFASNFFT
jgi:hypothetical protein